MIPKCMIFLCKINQTSKRRITIYPVWMILRTGQFENVKISFFSVDTSWKKSLSRHGALRRLYALNRSTSVRVERGWDHQNVTNLTKLHHHHSLTSPSLLSLWPWLLSSWHIVEEIFTMINQTLHALELGHCQTERSSTAMWRVTLCISLRGIWHPFIHVV